MVAIQTRFVSRARWRRATHTRTARTSIPDISRQSRNGAGSGTRFLQNLPNLNLVGALH